MSEKKDPGFVADVMASKGNEEAKRLLRLLGVVEMSEVCQHDWHYYGTDNGRPYYGCQTCGAERYDE